MKKVLAGGLLALVAAAGLAAMTLSPRTAPPLENGLLPQPALFLPDGNPSALLFLVSDAEGWGEAEEQTAARLRDRGIITIGIDLPGWLQRLDASPRACAYALSDLESVSRQIQRRLGLDHYLSPIVAGAGAGGGMALAIAAQSPAATLAATVSADPAPFIALTKPLCTPAEKKAVPGGMQYGLRTTPLTHAVTIALTPAALPSTRQHVRRLQASHRDIVVTEQDAAPDAALLAEITRGLEPHDSAAETLPVAVTPVEQPSDVMALIISGDGGWRDIDKKLAAHLAADGIPSVGLDSLRYFWSEKTPEQTARDLAALIDRHRARFKARRVIVIGYSFGANIVPASYRHLPAAQRDTIALVALLAPSPLADFRIAVTGWLGFAGEGKHGRVADDIARMGDVQVLCIFGKAEPDSACRDLQPGKARIIGLNGGHHFDGDYKALTETILAHLPDG